MLALTAPQQAALPGKVEEKVETLALSRRSAERASNPFGGAALIRRRGTGSKLAAVPELRRQCTAVLSAKWTRI